MSVLDKIKDVLFGAFNSPKNDIMTVDIWLAEDEFVYDGMGAFGKDGTFEFGMLTPIDDGKSMWLPASTTSPNVIQQIESAESGTVFKILEEESSGPLGASIKSLKAVDGVTFEIQKIDPRNNGLMPYLLTRQV